MKRRFRYLTGVGILALAYFASARLGLELATVNATVALVWPASGIALAALLLAGPGLWPGIVVGLLAAHLGLGTPPTFTLFAVAGNTLEAVLGAWLLRRQGFDPALARLRDVVLLTLSGALAASAVSATLGSIGLLAAGMIATPALPGAWLAWWVGNATGVLLLAPLLLTWGPPRTWRRPPRPGEGVLLVLTLLLASRLLFGDGLTVEDVRYPLGFLPFPLLVWAALRFGPRGTALASLILVGTAIWETALGQGPFVSATGEDRLFLAWTYLAAWILTGLSLAALLAERQQSRRLAEENRALLERRVAERTTELAGTAEQLRRERDFSNAVVDVVDALVCVLDREGRILGFNQACERLTRYRAEEVLGRHVWSFLIPPGQADAVRNVFTNLTAGDFPNRHENHWLTRAGEQRLIAWSNTALLDAGGAVEFVIPTGIDVTERRRAERQAGFFRALLDHSSDSIFIIEPDSARVIDANRSAWESRGYSRAELLGLSVPDLSLTTPDGDAWQRLLQHLRRQEHLTLEGRHRTRHGRVFPVELSVELIRQEGSEYVVSIARDITRRKQAEAELRLAASVFRDSHEAIMITTTAGRILKVNQAFTEITGYTEAEAVGQTPALLRSDRHDADFYESLWNALDHNGQWQGEIWNRRRNGELFPAWENISAVRDEAGRRIRYVSIFSDLTERHLSEQRIYRLAHYDVLTGLPNRALFQERLEQGLIHHRRRRAALALLFLDLDRFKRVNDSLGHAAGDRLLQIVAGRLAECVRESDTVARLGGDEFTIILDSIGAPEDATRVARKILAALAEPALVAGHELFVTSSIGIALFPRDAEDTQTLLRHADAAMYLAKERGRDNWQAFSPDINVAAAERMALESGLRRALEAGEFILEYQPQAELGAGRVVAVEALVRWSSPKRGIVAPAEFIPVAEETGLIVEIGAWVLETACRQLHEWKTAGLDPVQMAVNVSGRQFLDPRLPEMVARALAHHAVPPGCLELEITESCVMADARESIERLRQLKAMGLHVTIDDFGVAYSSLNHLKRLPIDKLKIDRSFVRDLPEDADDAAIAATIIAMGRSLDLTVVAEGVENEEQLAFLRAQGCDQIQGHYFCPPLPARGCTHFLATRPRLALD